LSREVDECKPLTVGLADEVLEVEGAEGCEGGGCEERSRRERMALPPGSWRDHFTTDNAARFQHAHGALLKGMGYGATGADKDGVIAAIK
jgi:hypothetical protein